MIDRNKATHLTRSYRLATNFDRALRKLYLIDVDALLHKQFMYITNTYISK